MTIFIRNLPKSWQKHNLFHYLDRLGIAVKRCLIPGKERGFGLVELTEQQSAEQAIALLNTQTLQGQQLIAAISTHPIAENANGSFDDKPQPGWSKSMYARGYCVAASRRAKPTSPVRHTSRVLKPCRNSLKQSQTISKQGCITSPSNRRLERQS